MHVNMDTHAGISHTHAKLGNLINVIIEVLKRRFPSNAGPACSPVFLPVRQLNLTFFQLFFPMVALANRGNYESMHRGLENVLYQSV